MSRRSLRELLSQAVPGLQVSLRSNFKDLVDSANQVRIANDHLNGELTRLRAASERLQEEHTNAVRDLSVENARLGGEIKALNAERARLTEEAAQQKVDFQRAAQDQEAKHQRAAQDQEAKHQRAAQDQEAKHQRAAQDQEAEYRRKLEQQAQVAELDYQNKLRALETSHLRSQLRDLRELRRQTAPAAARESWSLKNQYKKQLLVAVMTAVGQLSQLKALANSPQVRKAYDLAVIAYLEVKESGLLDFCQKNEITLFSHRLELLCGNQVYIVCGDPQTPKPYFGAAAALDALAQEDRPPLEYANSVLEEVHRQIAVKSKAQQFLRLSGASIVVLFEDNAEADTGAWVTGARTIGIPVVIVPFSIVGPEEAGEAHYNDPAYWADAGPINRFVRSTLPHWVYSYRDRPLIRRRASALLTSEVLGFAPPQPWVWNSSNSNVIAVENKAMREVYLSQRIPEAQIEVTGSVTDDLLYEALKRPDGILEQLEIDRSRPILVCAFPPNQLSAQRPECEFQDFPKIVDAWLGELSKLEGWQVVVKPHPAMQRGDIEYLKAFPFRVTELDTTALIAVCDVFNASVSSTIRWALACGKPVLNYDVYRYRYPDFVKEPAVITVFSFDRFAQELARLTSDRQVLAHYTNEAKAAADRWGMLDGKSTERILNLFSRLIDEQKNSLS